MGLLVIIAIIILIITITTFITEAFIGDYALNSTGEVEALFSCEVNVIMLHLAL